MADGIGIVNQKQIKVGQQFQVNKQANKQSNNLEKEEENILSADDPEVKRLTTINLKESKDMLSQEVINMAKNGDPRIKQNGNEAVLMTPFLMKRKINQNEKDMFFARMRALGHTKSNIDDYNYTLVLPGGKVNTATGEISLDFINILKSEIDKFGIRPIFIVNIGHMEYDGETLTRDMTNPVTYKFIFGMWPTQVTRYIISLDKNGKITDKDIKLDAGSFNLKGKEIRDICVNLYKKGSDGLDENEKQEFIPLLTNTFAGKRVKG